MNLFQRINAIQLKISSVYKGAKVSMGNSGSYNAVSHDDVTALLHQPIADVGIIAFPNMESAEVEPFETVKSYNGKDTVSMGYRVRVWASVTFINMDKPDERITTKCFSYALDNGDKATGKAYSMAIKYCYLKTFMLESCDEEESRTFEHSQVYSGQNNRSQTTETKPNPNHKDFKPTFNQNAVAGASEAQLNAVKKLYGKDYDVTNMTRNAASELIAAYNKGK